MGSYTGGQGVPKRLYRCIPEPSRIASSGMRLSLFTLLLSACVVDVGPGPFVGDCADYPDHTYTFGEIGIGTCLAGPTDLRFVSQDDQTLMLVTNADPYHNFSGGSFLVMDWDSVDLTADRNLMSDLTVSSLDTEHYVGQIGPIMSRRLALVSGRLSEGARTRDHDDRVHVIDIADPSNPVPWEQGSEITVKDDPFHIEVDEFSGEAYVVNLTDHSVSVLDITSTPIAPIDLAGLPDLDPAVFNDADDSGSLAELAGPTVTEATDVPNDLWTLSWADGTWRIWWPDDDGYARHTSGDGVTFHASALGNELDGTLSADIDEVTDPSLGTDSGAIRAWFSDRGTLFAATPATSAIGDWALLLEPTVGIGSWDVERSGPSAVGIDDLFALFYDGKASETGLASIGMALSEDALSYTPSTQPVLEAPTGASYEDPHVVVDPHTGGLRMWFSHFDGKQWHVAVTDGFDGTDWDEPTNVLTIANGHAAAPVVTWANGRYLMWAATSDGTAWALSHYWSYDGIEWLDEGDALAHAGTFDLMNPPRPMLQASVTGAFSIDAVDAGPQDLPIFSGSIPYELPAHGLSFTISTGQEAGTEVLAERSVNGIRPSGHAVVNSLETLYVTSTDGSLLPSIGAIKMVDGEWQQAVANIIPVGSGGNVAGAQGAAVVSESNSWTLFYGAIDAEGVTRIRRATSTNGLSFTPQPGLTVASEASFDAFAQIPHSVERVDADTWRLWYSGSNGNRFRIGTALSTDGGVTFVPEPGLTDDFAVGTGQPGDFDDTGVRDPVVVTVGDSRRLYFAGYDGESFHLGYADDINGEWVRPVHPLTDAALPALSGALRSFSSSGVSSPVVGLGQTLYFAGFDGAIERIGAGKIGPDPSVVFSAPRFPTVGDELTFTTTRGDVGDTVIELQQAVANFSTAGTGAAGLVRDPARGMLYIQSKLSASLFAVDIRDDTTAGFDDRNAYDLEGLISIPSSTTASGFRNGLVAGNRLYLTARGPDAVVVADLTSVIDNGEKEVDVAPAIGSLPLDDMSSDPGENTLANVGGAGMALAPDGRTLLVTHFRGNGVYVFDLQMGAFGEEIRFIPHIGENPHLVRISPDGRYAVVANYIGEVEERTAHGTLTVIDVDPNSETYLDIVTRIVNK
jgi:DNA-binding beta-propeller fold protein YncE